MTVGEDMRVVRVILEGIVPELGMSVTETANAFTDAVL